jgi:hypothetical protein
MRIAASYDDVFDRLDAAEQQSATHRDEQAVGAYRDVVAAADHVLATLGDRPRAASYATRHDGTIDTSLVITNLRAARANAAHLGDEASERFIEALERELHAKTPGQRAVLRQHGRPAVATSRGQTCWSYGDDADEERFCWATDGRLIKRTVGGTSTTAPPPPSPPTAPHAQSSIAYYAAATFASGSCSFGNCLSDGWTTSTPGGTVTTACSFGDCGKDGWTSNHPDGTTSTTSCHFGDCFKDGWTTSHPDNTRSETSCSFGDCLKDGWRTTMPDGSTSETSCNFGDCTKDGWTTRLPSGSTVTCSCNFGDCLKDGASCN